MKKSILQPMISDESVIVQFTDTVMFDKAIAVTVPNGYTAYVFSDEKAQFRIEPCSEKKIVSYGKELLGKNGRIAFVRTKPLPPMAWGFGNIQVNNERLKEAYRVGANGKYTAELLQPTKMIACFPAGEDITSDALRERTISAVKTIGISLLGTYFAGTEISVFEIASCMNDFRAKFLKALQTEPVFTDMGLTVKDLTVDGIHVPEEDIESIRSHINASEKKDDKASEELLKQQKKFAADLSRKMDEKFEQLRKLADTKPDDIPDIAGQIRSMREELAAELSGQLGDKMQALQDSLAERKGGETDETLRRAQEKFAADLSRKMDEKFEQLRKQLEVKSNAVPDFTEQINSIREELATELSGQLGDKMQELQDSLAERKGSEEDETLRKAQEKFAADLSRKMDEEFEQLRRQMEAKPSDIPDISGQIRSMREELAAELSGQLGDKMQEMQESIAESIDERLQELLPLKEQAKEEYLKTLKVTAGFLIDHAADEDGLVPAAAMLYTNIEENLIKKFRLRYENKKFVMDYGAYRSLVEDAPGLLNRYDALSPTVVREDDYGEPELVEMLPQVRFYEAGLDVSDSLTAREYWCFLNKLRHKSPENDAFLRRKFLNFAQEKKYITDALNFFKAHGLYTKE